MFIVVLLSFGDLIDTINMNVVKQIKFISFGDLIDTINMNVVKQIKFII